MNTSGAALVFSLSVFLALLVCLGPLQCAGGASPRPAQGDSSYPRQSRAAFLYGITGPHTLASTSAEDLANENRINVEAFRIRRDGSLVNVPLRYNPRAFASGYSGTVQELVASPDGRFLFAECENTHNDRPAPIFLQFRIQTDGQLQPFDRFSLAPGATHLVFHPSGRYAYVSCPDQSNSQTRPGAVVQFRVTHNGILVYPPVASVPCGPMPSRLTLDHQGRVGAVLDAETGFLWQYTLTPQGRLQPAKPPSVPVVTQAFTPQITADGRFLYIASQQSRQRYCVFQLGRGASGGFSLLTPRAVSVPRVIGDVAIASRQRAVYVSSGGRLFTFRIGPRGTLQPSRFSVNTVVDVSMAVDEAGGHLYVLGLHDKLFTYSIRKDGTLILLNKVPARIGYDFSNPTVVYR